jgi:hypothetical protein
LNGKTENQWNIGERQNTNQIGKNDDEFGAETGQHKNANQLQAGAVVQFPELYNIFAYL